MLTNIQKQQDKAQIIITTHNNLIASRLGLMNIIWLNKTEALKLASVDKNVADFFIKADNNAVLQLLLAEKVIIVEGATEYLLLPYIYKKVTQRTLEEDKVTVISCNGISYSNYLIIAEKADKKVAVITDNDKKLSRISEVESFNRKNNNQHIFMDFNTDNWTWEVCLYNSNKKLMDNFINVDANSEYLYKNESYGQVLGKMLNNKVKTAYELLMSGKSFNIPDYVEAAIEWLNK